MLQIVFLWCTTSIARSSCGLANASYLEPAPALMSASACARRLSATREAVIENDPRKSYVTTICASPDDVRREAMKAEAGIVRRIATIPAAD